ncbi:MAG: sensor histidine kinase [Anaerolineales bacterium]|nr:sensor histidine kinase [Anaerolineales bacterium]
MLWKLLFPHREFNLLYLTAYLSWAAVAFIELVVMPATMTQWMTAGLLLLFGLLLAGKPLLGAPGWQAHTYLALQTSLVTVLLLLRSGSLMLPMLFCILSVTAFLALPSRSAVFWLVIFIIINTIHCTLADKLSNILYSLPYSVGYIFCGIFAYSLAQAKAAQRRSQVLFEELQTTYQQLQEYAARVEELAVSQERNRLAREMHDALGHRLTVAAVQLEGAERLIPTNPSRAARMVNTVHHEVVDALAELRQTVATLRTPLDVDLSLPTALTRLTHSFEEATGIEVNRSLPEELPPLSDAHRLALYRAVQEALTNVQRHAQARQVWLELAIEGGTLTLLVKDNGRGFDSAEAQTGFGLRGLRERAAHLKGQFHLESTPGEGTQVCFHLPLPEESQAAPLPIKKPCHWKLICPFASPSVRTETTPRLAESS